MKEAGRIIEIRNELAKVQVVRKSACGGDCGKCAGCPSTAAVVMARNPMGAGVGEYVEISNNTFDVKKGVMWAYIVPLLTLVIGFAVGTLLFQSSGWKSNQELIQLISGLLFMGISYIVVHRIDSNLSKKGSCEFEIISKGKGAH